MALVPPSVYKRVEWYLHNRQEVRDKIAEYRDGVLMDGPSLDRGMPQGHSRHGDPTALRAIRLAHAPRWVREYESWMWVVGKTFDHFRGTRNGEMMRLYYGTGRKAGEVLELMELDRERSFYDLKTEVVCYAAMAAIQKGLIKVVE